MKYETLPVALAAALEYAEVSLERAVTDSAFLAQVVGDMTAADRVPLVLGIKSINDELKFSNDGVTTQLEKARRFLSHEQCTLLEQITVEHQAMIETYTANVRAVFDHVRGEAGLPPAEH